MKNNYLKRLAKSFYFRPSSERTIRLGPLRGMVYRVGDVTGLSPWYSGSEREHQRVFERLVRPGDLVIDVGANWGIHTLYLSKLVGPAGRVLSFEPFPNALEELKWHVEANGCRNVRIVEKAASDSDGDAVFAVGGAAQTGGLAEVINGSFSKEQIRVKTERLDSTWEGLSGKVRLIKIDVEGAETKVLLGARRLIVEQKPYLVIDLHTPEQDVSVSGLLSEWGYSLTRLSGPPILHLDRGWPDPDGVWGTILCSPANA